MASHAIFAEARGLGSGLDRLDVSPACELECNQPAAQKAHVAGSDHRHESGSINNLGILDTTAALADVWIPAFPPNGQTRGEQTEWLLIQIGDGRTLEHTVRLDSWIIDTPLQLAVCECEFFANRFERRRRPCRRKQVLQA